MQKNEMASDSLGMLELLMTKEIFENERLPVYPPRVSVSIPGRPSGPAVESARDLGRIFKTENRVQLVVGSGSGEVSRILCGRGASKVLNFESSDVLKAVSFFSDAISGISQNYVNSEFFSEPNTAINQIIDLRLHDDLAESIRIFDLPFSTAALVLVSESIFFEFAEFALRKIAVCLELDTVNIPHSSGEPNIFVLVACCTSKISCWEAILNLQADRLRFHSYHTFDVWDSHVPAFSRLKQDIATGLVREVAEAPPDVAVHIQLNRNAPTNLSDSTYWMEFFRGVSQLKAAGGSVGSENSYLRCVERMMESGHMFDPGAMKNTNIESFRARLISRMKNALEISLTSDFDLDSEACSCVSFISNSNIPDVMKISNSRGEQFGVAGALDGYHRMGARLLFGGGRLYHAHLLKVHGKFV